MSLYKEILETGIIFKRPIRILLNLFFMFMHGEQTCKPLMLKFESSALCNLKCRMCPLSVGLSREKGVLSFERFKKIYDEVRPVYVNLTGIGEPFLNKDIFKIIKYAIKKKSLVKLDTNATLLDQEKIEKIIDAKPTFISISLDGANKKDYEFIRKGAKFEDVVSNINKLVGYRNLKKSKVKIHLFHVLQKKNLSNFVEFIRLGERIGVDTINGTIVSSLGKNKNKENMKIEKEKFLLLKKDIEKIKKTTKINLNIEGIENYLEGKKDKVCFWPWYQTSITWDGYVTPCCIFCDNEIVFGNVFEQPFMGVINSEKAKRFRKQLAIKRTGICKDCNVNEEYIDKNFKIIQKIPLLNNLSKRK